MTKPVAERLRELEHSGRVKGDVALELASIRAEVEAVAEDMIDTIDGGTEFKWYDNRVTEWSDRLAREEP